MECEKIEPADKTEEHLDEEKVCIDRNFLSSKEYVRLEELTNLRTKYLYCLYKRNTKIRQF